MPLSPPPLKNGVVVPHNHEQILDDDDIIRRISEEQCVTTAQGRRVSSIAFQASSGINPGMSIDIKKSIEEAQLVVIDFVTTPRWIGSAILKASMPRSAALMVGYEPIPENAHHGEVWGTFDRKISKRLQRNSQWLVPIPGVALV